MPGTTLHSPVMEFYNDANIFITGGTGFLGKILVEKILRVFTNINHIYLLIRTKQGKDSKERLKELFAEPVFNQIRKEHPDFIKKVTCISGDTSKVRLNISDQDYELLANEVTHIFHSAATVRFNEKLSTALDINVQGTQEILKLCKKCIRLKILVHVSTAYSNCHRQIVNEIYYESPMSGEAALNLKKLLKEEKLNSIAPELIKPWPNTYSFTKAIAENIVKEQGKNLPVLIVRPSIVMGALKEPIGGWVDNMYGPTGLIAAAGLGLIRVLYIDYTKVANMVPVDLTVNAFICCAWAVGSSFNNNTVIENSLESTKDSEKFNKESDSQPKIFNFVSRKDNSLLWGKFLDLCQSIGMTVPSIKTVWCYSIVVTRFKFLYTFLSFFLHMIPGAIVDLVYILLGKKPQMREMYKKIDSFSDIFEVFVTHTWDFSDDNVQEVWNHLSEDEKNIFNFDMSQINWENYLPIILRGIRLFVLKDEDATLPAAKRKIFFFWIAHRFFQFILLAFFFWTLSKVFMFFVTFMETPLEESFVLKPQLIRNSS